MGHGPVGGNAAGGWAVDFDWPSNFSSAGCQLSDYKFLFFKLLFRENSSVLNMILSRIQSPRLLLGLVRSSLATRPFIVAAFLAATCIVSWPGASAEPCNLPSAIKSLLDVVKIGSHVQTEHVQQRHELVGLSPSGDDDTAQNAALSEVHAAAVSDLHNLQKHFRKLLSKR